jgi:putative copper resistance protein D
MAPDWIAPFALASLRAVHVAACLVLAGFWVFDRMLPPERREGAAWRRSLRRANLSLFPLVLLSGVGWFLAVAQAMGDGAAFASAGVVWEQTAFGTVAQVRFAVFLVAALAVAVARHERGWAPWDALAACAVLAASLAWTGHGGTGSHPSAHRVADMMHLLAAGVWPAGLVPLFYYMRQEPLDAAVLRRFSALSLGAVAALAATGWVNAVALVGSWPALWQTAYGRVLLAKLGLFLVLLALGAANFRRLAPRMAEPGVPARLARNVAVELAVAAALIGLVAWLGLLPPASGPGP